MTKKERAELKALADEWENYVCYSFNYEYADGYEKGMANAACSLTDWLYNN